MQLDLVPLLDDKKEAVRVRASAAYIRLEQIKSEKLKPAKAKKTNERKLEKRRY
jgi:hypothetical protein